MNLPAYLTDGIGIYNQLIEDHVREWDRNTSDSPDRTGEDTDGAVTPTT